MRKLALVLVLVAPALVGACSSGDDGGTAEAPVQTLPDATGDSCTDPASDITAEVKVDGVGSEPAGIDITAASVELTEDDLLDISFTTVGPITQASGTTFAVAQGTPFTALAFEVRANAGEGGTWSVEVITWDTGERRTSVPVSPVVAGNTLTFSVPMEDLPPLGLYHSYGASSVLDGVGRVLDDCTSLTTEATVG